MPSPRKCCVEVESGASVTAIVWKYGNCDKLRKKKQIRKEKQKKEKAKESRGYIHAERTERLLGPQKKKEKINKWAESERSKRGNRSKEGPASCARMALLYEVGDKSRAPGGYDYQLANESLQYLGLNSTMVELKWTIRL